MTRLISTFWRIINYPNRILIIRLEGWTPELESHKIWDLTFHEKEDITDDWTVQEQDPPLALPEDPPESGRVMSKSAALEANMAAVTRDYIDNPRITYKTGW